MHSLLNEQALTERVQACCKISKRMHSHSSRKAYSEAPIAETFSGRCALVV